MAVIKRLSKVARELNVGISTIVDFLNEQGKEVSSNPNTKIDENLYMLLLQEFQSEKFKKEKADQVRIEQTERKVISIKKEEVPKKEEVEKIIAKADKLSGPSVLGKIDLTPKPKLPTKKEEPKVEIEKKEEKAPKVEQQPSSKKSEEKVSEPKVVVDTIKAEAKKAFRTKSIRKD
jgi:translation initiation factor IF-2